MRDVIRRLEDLEAGRAREQEQMDAHHAEPMGCPEGLSPGQVVDWWLGLPNSLQRRVEMRAMSNEQFFGFIDAMAERFPDHAARFNRARQAAAASPAAQ